MCQISDVHSTKRKFVDAGSFDSKLDDEEFDSHTLATPGQGDSLSQ